MERAPSVAAWTPSPALINVLVAMLCLIWGSTWLVIKEGLDDLPPLTSAAARFAVASVVFALVTPPLRRWERAPPPPLWLCAFLGATNFAASYGIVYATSVVLPSGVVSVLWAVFPLIMAVLGHLCLGERLTARHASGFVLGFAGVVLLFAADLGRFGPEAVPAALLLFLSPLSAALGTAAVKRFGERHSSAVLNRNALLVGAALLAVAALLAEGDAPARWTGRAWFTIVYLAVPGTCVSFGVMFFLLRFARATHLSLIAYVTPCIALFLGWLVRGEALLATTVAGAGLVVLGVALVTRRRRPK